jgi:hypothetical protein
MSKRIIRFYNWKNWQEDIDEGRVGLLGSDKTIGSYLAVAAMEAENPSNDVWLLTASKQGKWGISAWLKLRPRHPGEPKSNDTYAHLVYYDLSASKIIGDSSTGMRAEIPEIDAILQTIKNLGMQGNAGFEFNGKDGDQIFREMQKIPGISFPAEVRSRKLESEEINPDFVASNRASSISHEKAPGILKKNESIIPYVSEVEIAFVSTMNVIELEYRNKPGEDVDVVVKRRVGQSEFRALLASNDGMACHISGLAHKRLLIASHIVPWSKATGEEKTDPDNGLLLAVNWDAVFDKGFISFDDLGKVIISDELDDDSACQLGIDKNARLREGLLTPKRLAYLKRHREEIFERWKKVA